MCKTGSPRKRIDERLRLAFAPYLHMDFGELQQLQLQRYPDKVDFQKEELISSFNTQSLVTGNVGGRIACANIHGEEHAALTDNVSVEWSAGLNRRLHKNWME